MAFRTPVLLLVFNRPNHTRRVFEQIRRMLPTQLFISADGPRLHVPGEIEKCEAVRAIVDQVDWDCDLHVNFSAENLGCRKAVASGISWFFEQVPEGIILEDDCYPEESFFNFCSQMLDYYRDDAEVMHISGSNPTGDACKNLNASYVFSRYPFIWGWATWRRAWARYDADFSGLEQAWLDPESGFSKVSTDATARRYLYDKFLRTRDGEFNTWDYAWFYSILKHKGLCVNPCDNLILNIGFDQEATHTRSTSFTHKTQKISQSRHDLVHPASRSLDPDLERVFFHSSQKHPTGLLLRRLFPRFFFRAKSGAETQPANR